MDPSKDKFGPKGPHWRGENTISKFYFSGIVLFLIDNIFPDLFGRGDVAFTSKNKELKTVRKTAAESLGSQIECERSMVWKNNSL